MRFIKPVGGVVTNTFGPRESFQLPDGRWTIPYHYGADFALPAGTPIVAPYDGVVVFSGFDYGYHTSEPMRTMEARWGSSHIGGGNMVIVESGDWWFVFFHLQKPSALKVGAKVRQGAVIGYVGTTGASTGNHLHLETWYRGEPVNPADWFGKTLKNAIIFGKEYKMASYTPSTAISVGAGKTKRLPLNKKGTLTISTKIPYLISGGAYLTGGAAGETIQLMLLKDVWDPKLKKTVKTGVHRRVSVPFDKAGKARLQITGIVEPGVNIRWRLAVQNGSGRIVKVTRITLDKVAL